MAHNAPYNPHHRGTHDWERQWRQRPQDRYGFLPEALFETRRSNLGKPVDKARKSTLLRSYLPDWIITILLWGLFYLIDKVQGFRREFDINDTTIMHTFAEHERIPVWMLAVIAILIPAVIMGLFSGLVLRSFWDVHNAILGLVLSLALTITTTDIIKVTVGRPRPDMLDRCQPLPGSTNSGYPDYGLSNSSICQSTDSSKLNDGFRSFPSGHSSSAWCGLGFFALWMAGKLHLFDRRGHSIKAWLALTPLVAAALVSVSRTMDYRHHWQDVLVGGILGYLFAWLGYRLYYPPLHDPQSHKPYSPRVPSDDAGSEHGDWSSEPPDGTVQRPMGGRGSAPMMFDEGSVRHASGARTQEQEQGKGNVEMV